MLSGEVIPMEQRSLLEGNITRQLAVLAAPLLLGNILQQLYNSVDALIISRLLGLDAFAAAGAAGTVMDLFLFVLSGFCVGMSVLFARLYGAGDLTAFRRETYVALTLGSAATLLLSTLATALLGPLLALIQVPEALLGYARSYLSIILGGLLAPYLYDLLCNILRSVGNTAAALWFLLLSVCVNGVLDYLLVKAMGIAGAAWATVAAQLLSALLCWLYLRRRYPQLLCGREDAGWHRALVRDTLRFGLTSALHQSSLYIGKLLVQGSVDLLGTPGVAAYTAALRVEGFANSFGDSGSQAAAVFLSQNDGAGQTVRMEAGYRRAMVMLTALGALLSLMMFFGAEETVGLFLKKEETIALGYSVSYLRVISLFYIFNDMGSILMGWFRGTGHVAVPVAVATLHITLRVVLSRLWVPVMGLAGVALASGLGWILAVSTLWLIRRHVRRTVD